MRIPIVYAILVGYSTSSNAQPVIDWQRVYGGSGSDQVAKIASHTDGGFFAVGRTNSIDGDITTAFGNLDVWVIRLSSTGDLMWERSLGGSGSDRGMDIIATDDGGCILIAETQSTDGMVTTPLGGNDIWIVKLSFDGQVQWERSIGGSNGDTPRNIVAIDTGGYIISAQSASPETPGFHPPGPDYYVAHISTSGELMEHRCFGGSESENAWAMTRTAEGLTVTCGTTRSTDGDVVGNLADDVSSIWVLAVDDELNIQWQRILYNTSGTAQAYSICQGAGGHLLVTGSTTGPSGDVVQTFGENDIWVVSLAAGGALLESTSLGGSDVDLSRKILSNSSGGSYVIGTPESNDGIVPLNNGESDGWIISLTNDLMVNWQLTLGGASIDRFFGGSIAADGGLLAAGSTMSSETGLGLEDFWVVKFKPEMVSIPESKDEMNVRLAPNPTQDHLTITWSGELSHLTICDPLGKLVYTSARLNGVQHLELPVQDWAQGLYTIHFHGRKVLYSDRFLKY